MRAKAVTVPGKPDGLLAPGYRLFSLTWGSPTRSDLDENVVHQVARERPGGQCCKPVDKNFLENSRRNYYGMFGQGVLPPWRAGRRKADVSGIAARRLTVKPVNT